MGGKPEKCAKTDKKATNTERAKTNKKATATEINIKLAGETPEDLKKAVVAQLIKEGKVRKTRSIDFSKM